MLRPLGFLCFALVTLSFLAGGLTACGKSSQGPALELGDEKNVVTSERRSAIDDGTYTVGTRSYLAAMSSSYRLGGADGLATDNLYVATDGSVYYSALWKAGGTAKLRRELVGTLRDVWVERFHSLVAGIPMQTTDGFVRTGPQGWLSTDEHGNPDRSVFIRHDDGAEQALARFQPNDSTPTSAWLNTNNSRAIIGTMGSLLRVVRSMYPSAP